MKTIVIGIIIGITISIAAGSIVVLFMAQDIVSSSNVERDITHQDYKCVQIFDTYLVPIWLGQAKSSEVASSAGKEFLLAKCASNHSRWKDLSINQEFAQSGWWNALIESEQKLLAENQKQLDFEGLKSEIFQKNISASYKINTECEFVLLLVVDRLISKFTFKDIQSDTFKTKYPKEISVIQKYNDLYDSITEKTRDTSDAYKQFPSEVLDATFEIMSNEASINPQLKSFANSVFFGELTNERGNQIALNDKTECGVELQKLI